MKRLYNMKAITTFIVASVVVFFFILRPFQLLKPETIVVDTQPSFMPDTQLLTFPYGSRVLALRDLSRRDAKRATAMLNLMDEKGIFGREPIYRVYYFMVLGNIALHKGDNEKARYYAQQLELFAKNNSLVWVEADSLVELAIEHLKKGEIEKGINKVEYAIELAKSINYEYLLIKAYNTIGVGYNIKSQYSKALYYFHQGVKLASSYPEHIYNSKLISNLALIYIHLQEWDKALINIDKAKELYNRSMLHELSVLGILDMNASYVYFNLENAERSRQYYDMAKKEITASDSIRLNALLLKTLSELYWLESNYKDALVTANHCIRYDGIETAPLQKGLCLKIKAKVDLEYQNIDDAIESLVEATEIFTIIESKVYLNEVYKLLSLAYEEKGFPSLALDYYKLYSEGNERILFDRRQSEVFHLEEQFNTENIQKNIALLNTQSELNNLYVEKQKLRTRLVSAVIILIAFGLFRLVRHNFSISKEKDALVEQSTKDALTGLNNRYYYESMIKILNDNRAFYVDKKFTIAILDIDHFKKVNDTHGHDMGDIVLKKVADHLQTLLNDSDTVVRWGGEEFVCLLLGSDHYECEVKLNRLRVAISKLSIMANQTEELVITISIGAVKNLTIDDVLYTNKHCLHIADQYLYQAKEQGRNRVVIKSKPEVNQIDNVVNVKSVLPENQVMEKNE